MFVCSVSNFVDVFIAGLIIGVPLGVAGFILGYKLWRKEQLRNIK